MWLGEQITERGIGNGMSLIIFTGIVVNLPNAIFELWSKVSSGDWNLFQVLIILIMMVGVVGFIVLVERGERRIPVQYAKRVVGRRMMGGQSTHLPLKVNAGGVIPVIFASSLLAFPQTLTQVQFVKDSPVLSNMLGAIGGAQPLYYLLYTVLIIFFCFFYVSIIFNRTKPPTICASTADSFRYPSGQEHGGLHEQDPDPHHGGRRIVSGDSIAVAADHDLGD